MLRHTELNDIDLRHKIRKKEICFGGNKKLSIYGNLNCSSGKRMNRVNRVFFSSVDDAEHQVYRPCGNCMRSEYKRWIYLNA